MLTPPDSPRCIEALLEIMRALRSPEGCPWDREQTFASIAPYTIEESYEVAEAISDGDMQALKNELGDLLFQVVYAEIIEAMSGKLVRRDPNVFANAQIRSAEDQARIWESMKANERADKGLRGILDDVPVALPALTRALKLQSRAARVGFAWPDAKRILAKLDEEIAELTAEIAAGDKLRAAAEIGDAMFVLVNLARFLDFDPEAALRATNRKFERRFQFIERACAEAGRPLQSMTLGELEALWTRAKDSLD